MVQTVPYIHNCLRSSSNWWPNGNSKYLWNFHVGDTLNNIRKQIAITWSKIFGRTARAHKIIIR